MNPSTKQSTPANFIWRHLKVITLGQAQVLVHGQPAKWHSDSARALFFYLLSNPNGKSHEEVIDVLWNTEPNAASSNRFRVTVHRLRKALDWREAIFESHNRYQLDQMVLQAVDTHEFYVLLAQAEDAGNPKLRLEFYQQALALYAGDYLPHETAPWVLKLRNEHSAAYARAKVAVSLLNCKQGLCGASVGSLRTALQSDPFLGENHHQKLMSCLSVVEGKFGAIEYYRRFVAFLKNDLEDTPMPETIVLAERIKAGERICLRALHLANTPVSLHNPFVPDFHIQSLPMFEQRVLS
jgi:two-component SAPR family response regulator